MGGALGSDEPMKTSNLKSTYELIVASEAEDKKRFVLETVIYALFILSAVFSIWQVAIQPIVVPTTVAAATVNASQLACS
jgi:hypothetical protein